MLISTSARIIWANEEDEARCGLRLGSPLKLTPDLCRAYPKSGWVSLDDASSTRNVSHTQKGTFAHPHYRSSPDFVSIMKIFRIVGAFFFSCLPAITRAGISTTSGLIFGHAASNKTEVIEYLGIPYAASTSGGNRFKPPQRFNSAGLFNASTG